jgi:hypothetical protein
MIAVKITGDILLFIAPGRWVGCGAPNPPLFRSNENVFGGKLELAERRDGQWGFAL